MSLTTSEMTPADFAAVTGRGGGGMGGYGDGAWWLIILFLFAFMGRGFGGGYGSNGGGGGTDSGLYPWLNQSNQINDGFRDQMLATNINGIQNAVTSGFGDVQQALCGGFAGVNASISGAQNAIAQQLYTNQISDLERSFAAQTANTQGLNALQSQLAQCCCDNRLATEGLNATIARESCATRENANYATRDIINSQNAGFQRILDQMCQDKIDAKNDTIAQLRQELIFARGQASQDVQTATIQAGQRALANEVEQYVLPTPRPAYIVSNPNCCNNNCGCGNNCGCNNNCGCGNF